MREIRPFLSWQDAAARLDQCPINFGKRSAMTFRQITDDYFVAPQIGVEDIARIREAGFRSVISNRPDSEDGTVPHDAIEAAARAARLAAMDERYRRQLLEAMAAVAAHDGVIRGNELELLRTTAAALDCPMPPLAVPGS